MKKSIIIFAAILTVGLTTKVMAQGVTENTAASAKIVTPITISETEELNFGTMSAGLSGGTCELTTAGVRNITQTVNLSANAPTATNAEYSVTGEPSTTYIITLPGTITVTSGSNNMTIGNLKAKCASQTADGNIGILNSGADSFKVGGTLTLGAAQASGTYTGDFNVTINYN